MTSRSLSRRTQTVGDIDIHYQIQGSGPPLVMIIGLSFSLRDWGADLIQRLSSSHQLILFDNRDAGLTQESRRNYTIQDMADDTAGLIKALGISKADIFGVSMGGAIAQHLALRHPNTVDRLILGCTFAGGDCSQPGDFTGFLSGNLPSLLFTPEYLDQHQGSINDFLDQTRPYHSSGSALHRQLNAIATHDTCDRLADIVAPTLVITGDRDIAIPAANSQLLAERIPKARLEIIPEAAHGFCYSHAQTTAEQIQMFLALS
ncbi:alpha/beta fold hydrolase [Lyngbya confervoides]|uniref:Alpha/beta hydrolase n=1 Tax=Lyngbya confervoides BDU141951 TaxID=1574623 RepID=A0ABD4T6G1_9CYAN|nr:alpha/beta hydrolase [Lyngbya confervoides]MCM1984049.1 alpha/beta hydrolase [Lyngbya confervoides BDU141951]